MRGVRAKPLFQSLKSAKCLADSAKVSDVTSIDQLLEQMVQLNASDLHLTVGAPPVVRLKGHLQRFDGVPAMSADNTRDLLYRILSTEQQKRLELARQLDFAHSIPGVARFRVNV
ncbi:MAG: twitching motility protein PilT, partial [Gaiellaceae bacterium]|nr:twitching motility protein PilT [Gaiellaceae bacterium]